MTNTNLATDLTQQAVGSAPVTVTAGDCHRLSWRCPFRHDQPSDRRPPPPHRRRAWTRPEDDARERRGVRLRGRGRRRRVGLPLSTAARGRGNARGRDRAAAGARSHAPGGRSRVRARLAGPALRRLPRASRRSARRQDAGGVRAFLEALHAFDSSASRGASRVGRGVPRPVRRVRAARLSPPRRGPAAAGEGTLRRGGDARASSRRSSTPTSAPRISSCATVASPA